MVFTQLFAFAFCIVAVGLALMLQQLPEHRKPTAGVESAGTAATGVAQRGEADTRPQTSGNPCDGLQPKRRRACQRFFADTDVTDDEPQEEPELD
jgi:hypothetical protein